VASAVAKPDGLLEVPAGGELAFLHPLPVERVWGVGPVTAGKLHAHGLTTVADVSRLSENQLVSLLGRAAGRQLHALSHNRDPRRVRLGVRRRSIGAQCAIGWRPKSWAAVDATLVGLVDRLSRRLRAGHRVGRTVVLRLRFNDFSRATRSHTLPEPTAETRTILATARELLVAATPLIETKGLTLVGVTLSNLEHDDDQLLLPVERRRAGALDAALDAVRDRFGSDAIVRAVLLGRDRGIEVPLLPDLE
jgi:DNA polymerase-4